MISIRECLLVLSVSGTNILNIFENGALIVILSSLATDLNFEESDLQWPLSIFALLHASLLLPCGRIADILGSRRMFLVGTAWFSLWSVACGFAPNKVAFIIFVAMTGIGAAANTPTGIGILTTCFEEGPPRNRAVAALGAGQGVGYVLGLVIGGFLCRTPIGWRAIFFIQGGFAFLFFIAGYFTIPLTPSDRRYQKGLDIIGVLLSVVGVALFIFSLSYSTTAPSGWKTPWIPVLLVVSLLILSFFVYYERQRELKSLSVILPISIWLRPGAKMKRFVGMVFMCWASFNSITYLLNVYWQEAQHLSPVQTAIRLAPTALTSFILCIFVGWLLEVIPPQYITLSGLLGGAASSVTLALITLSSPYWPLPLLSLILSAFNDAVYIVANLQISLTLDKDSQALAGGIFNVATRLGASFGLSLSAAVLTEVQKYHDNLPPSLALVKGIQAAGWTCLALSGASFIIAVFSLKNVRLITPKDSAVSSCTSEKQGGDQGVHE